MYTIYALVDPRDQSVRYVGLSQNIYARFAQHITCNGNHPQKDAWVRELELEQLMVIMQSLEKAETLDTAREREYFWIHYYLDAGASLFNIQLASPRGRFIKPSQPAHPIQSYSEKHVTYQWQYRRCGKPGCRAYISSEGHGPYWYAYWHENGKLKSAYVGKSLKESFE